MTELLWMWMDEVKEEVEMGVCGEGGGGGCWREDLTSPYSETLCSLTTTIYKAT